MLAERGLQRRQEGRRRDRRGHTVTALYEIVPAGVEAENELVTVKLRYKAPDADTSRLVSAVTLDAPSR